MKESEWKWKKVKNIEEKNIKKKNNKEKAEMMEERKIDWRNKINE